MTGLQLAFLRAASFPTYAGAISDRTFQISIEDSVIAKNQVRVGTRGGAMCMQAGMLPAWGDSKAEPTASCHVQLAASAPGL